MKIYKIKLKLKSSYITPWQSDTIFGSLCWAMVEKHGKNLLREFLDEYKNGKYPLVVSDGFPGDLLPKPMAGNVFDNDKNLIKNEALKISQKAKLAKKTNHISLEEFNLIINNQQVEITPKEKIFYETGVMHNQISRLTGTTMEGDLFEQKEIFTNSHLSIYFSVEPEWQETVLKLFLILAVKGFGKRTSIGKGHFSIEEISEFTGFSLPEKNKANAFVTLSNYIPNHTDPTIGQYKVFVKYGKLGQSYAHAQNPFKRPLLMIKPGAVFWCDNPRFTYGRLVENVSLQFSHVIQCGCTLAIPAYIEKPTLLDEQII